GRCRRGASAARGLPARAASPAGQMAPSIAPPHRVLRPWGHPPSVVVPLAPPPGRQGRPPPVGVALDRAPPLQRLAQLGRGVLAGTLDRAAAAADPVVQQPLVQASTVLLD